MMSELSSAVRCALIAIVATAALASAAASPAAAPRPHVILVALDDYGWADSWHRPAGSNESQIPTLDALVAEGIDLARHYVFQYCSPSRSALHTGRNPLHVNVLNSYLDIACMPTATNQQKQSSPKLTPSHIHGPNLRRTRDPNPSRNSTTPRTPSPGTKGFHST